MEPNVPCSVWSWVTKRALAMRICFATFFKIVPKYLHRDSDTACSVNAITVAPTKGRRERLRRSPRT